MSAESHQQLHELYVRLGDALASRGRNPEAADAYALALYYARQNGDAERATACRQYLAQLLPTHPAAKEGSAPLLFAQLLMKYPADEAERTLTEMNVPPSNWEEPEAPALEHSTRPGSGPVGTVAVTNYMTGASEEELEAYRWVMQQATQTAGVVHERKSMPPMRREVPQAPMSIPVSQPYQHQPSTAGDIPDLMFGDIGMTIEGMDAPPAQPNQKWMNPQPAETKVAPPKIVPPTVPPQVIQSPPAPPVVARATVAAQAPVKVAPRPVVAPAPVAAAVPVAKPVPPVAPVAASPAASIPVTPKTVAIPQQTAASAPATPVSQPPATPTKQMQAQRPQPAAAPRPPMPVAAEMEQHHVYDLGANHAPQNHGNANSNRQYGQSLRAAEDFLLKSTTFPDTEPFQQPAEVRASGTLRFFAGLTMLASCAAIAFFGSELYPRFSREKVREFVQVMLDGKVNRPETPTEPAPPAPALVKISPDSEKSATTPKGEMMTTAPARESISLKPKADISITSEIGDRRDGDAGRR